MGEKREQLTVAPRLLMGKTGHSSLGGVGGMLPDPSSGGASCDIPGHVSRSKRWSTENADCKEQGTENPSRKRLRGGCL